MTSSLVERLLGTSHPRLAVLILIGITLLAFGGTLALVDTISTLTFGPLSFRIGVVGYLLLALGVAGYLGIGVFQRQPEP